MEILDNATFGLLVPCDDAPVLAEAMQQALCADGVQYTAAEFEQHCQQFHKRYGIATLCSDDGVGSMNKPVVVHVITNFAGVGGAEMMLSCLVAQTQAEYEHIIISLMHVSNVYAETLKLCSSHYSLNWKGINSFECHA